jgi:primosomal protein N'
MSDSKRFVVCVRNDEYEGALELRKIYEVLDDPDAEPHDLIRLVDESGEDYLYPRDWFLPLQLPPTSSRRSSTSRAASPWRNSSAIAAARPRK